MSRIPLSVPLLGPKTYEHVKEAIDTQWVSTGGAFIRQFEEHFSNYVHTDVAAALQSGTSALHLALILAGVQEGDYVLAPNLTFIAAINPIYYQRAEAIFFDCDESLGISAKQVEEFLKKEAILKEDGCYHRDGRRIRALQCVHVFGNLCDIHRLKELCDKYQIKLVEDATEALGSFDDKGFAGTFGDYGCFSFNGNKIITTGGGGMLISRYSSDTLEARRLSTQARVEGTYSTHDKIGFNYRMTNLQAALGISQLESIEDYIKTKEENYLAYQEGLKDLGLNLLPFRENTRSNYWFYSLDLGDKKEHRDALMNYLLERDIEVRPIWDLMSEQAPFKGAKALEHPRAKDYLERIINIPSSAGLTPEERERVLKTIGDYFREK